jgi:hypothetical protein
MSRVKLDGNVRIAFVPGEGAIADIHAPVLADVNDAANVLTLAHQLTPDGLNINLSEDTKDVSRFDSTFNHSEPGRSGGTIDLTYFRDSIEANEDAQTVMLRDVVGYLIIRYGKPATSAFIATDVIEIYPVTCGNQRPGPTPKNADRVTVQTLYISDDWDTAAVIAA